MITALKSLLVELSEASGPPGFEGPVRKIFQREFADIPLACDRLGNVSATVSAAKASPRVVVTSHLDEIGFLVQHITEFGFIQFVPVGGWWSHTLLAQRVRIVNSSGRVIPGVITAVPYHFVKPKQKDQLLGIDQMYIDVGANSQAEVEEGLGVQLGDPIVPDTSCVPMANENRLMGKAFDNRVGVAVMIEASRRLLGMSSPNTLLAVGTVQEELGMRGAALAGQLTAPDVALVLEGPPADDGPEFNRSRSQGRLGGGVQIRVMDPSAVMNRPLVDFAIATAEAHQVPHQVAVRRTGATDARAFQCSGSGCPVVVLGVPTRYIHTHHAILDIRDVKAAVDLVLAMVQRLDEDMVVSFTRHL